MNFVFISPNFPSSYEHFCIDLHENGVNVLGIGDAPYDSLTDSLKAALTESYRVDSLKNYDQMIRAMGHFTASYGFQYPVRSQIRPDHAFPFQVHHEEIL